MSAAAVAAALGDAKREGRNWRCRCPLHGGCSLMLADGRDGKLLVTCYGGNCDRNEVLAELRRRGLLPEPGGGKSITATYDYVDEDGRLLFQVCRLVPKNFLQRRPDGTGGWIWRTEGVRKVLYRLPDLVAAAKGANGAPWRVYICEGEKDVDRMREQWGVVATTNPGGAGKWRRDYARYFSGADVVILPDNDDAGGNHVQTVAPSTPAEFDILCSRDVVRELASRGDGDGRVGGEMDD